MRAVKQGLLWALVTATGATAYAGTVHKVRFAQPAQILVWEEGQLIARGARVQVSGFEPVVAEGLVGDGTLLPANTPSDARKIISIASNTGFSLKSRTPAATANVSVRVLGVGENAQALGDVTVTAPDTVFQQAAKTALKPGHPSSQAIELEISWSGLEPPDLYLVAMP